ncbi:MAG: hypothetical protein AAGJ55_12225 [Cyanobacteria bacterium J06555_12]
MPNRGALMNSIITTQNLKRLRLCLRIARHISIVLFVFFVLTIEFLWQFLQWLNTVVRPEVERVCQQIWTHLNSTYQIDRRWQQRVQKTRTWVKALKPEARRIVDRAWQTIDRYGADRLERLIAPLNEHLQKLEEQVALPVPAH